MVDVGAAPSRDALRRPFKTINRGRLGPPTTHVPPEFAVDNRGSSDNRCGGNLLHAGTDEHKTKLKGKSEMLEVQNGKSNMAEPHRPGLKVGSRTEFCVIGDVIPGHEDTLRQVLRRHMENPRTQEAVDQIGILHEARFVLLDGGKRLMFCSSYDGLFDPYIDDFAVTAIGQNFDESWEHVEGYPGVKSPTIKDWFVAHAVQAGNFVCAYPQPSVKQIWHALAVEQAFQQVLDSPGAGDALQHPALKPLLDLAAD
jgi:hypothetical protein